MRTARVLRPGSAPAVWDSSIVLAKFFERWPQRAAGKRCLDLSAGWVGGVALRLHAARWGHYKRQQGWLTPGNDLRLGAEATMFGLQRLMPASCEAGLHPPAFCMLPRKQVRPGGTGAEQAGGGGGHRDRPGA